MAQDKGSPLLLLLLTGSGLAVGLMLGAAAMRASELRSAALLPPASSTTTLVRPTQSVLLAVKDLARLESAVFHMERVIDLRDEQSRMFGLIQSEDAILLVAVADVSGGIDLQKLAPGDVQVDPGNRRVRISLPAPEVFHAELDNAHTYVHTRRTDVLAERHENLETRARQEAERTLVDAAKHAGLMQRASENARHVIEGLVRSLGYSDVEVRVKPEPTDAAPAEGQPPP